MNTHLAPILENRPGSHKSPAEYRVQAVLNTFMRRQGSDDRLVAQLLSVCREHPSATWQALSMLDQLHRREVLSTELFRAIKSELNVIVFSSTGAYEAIPSQSLNGRRQLQAVVSGMRSRSTTNSFPIVELDLPLNLPESANAISFEPLRLGALLNDRYVIVEPLSAGCASVTFKALDRQRTTQPEAERYVAIRWLDEHLQSNPHAIAALQNEYAHWQAITHANIPKAYEMYDAIGACSIVMELPAGEFLHGISGRIAKRLPLAQSLALVREIGCALAHAHSRNVVHGNLHLGSVLVTRSGDVRVYDFAQADAWATLADDAIDAAQHSVPLAARRYCSPQRLNAESMCATDDLYSLAAIAYELLCGCPVDIEALRSSAWRQPVHAKHLSKQQWRTLMRGLSFTPSERGAVDTWLVELGVDAAPRLLQLGQITAEAVPANRYSVPRWY